MPRTGEKTRATAIVPARPFLLGLIGAHIGLSRSPALHQGAAADLGMACVYRLVDLDPAGLDATALPDLLTAAERFGFDGLNVTFPCKQAVIPHLHELSPHALALGAVNTVVLKDGKRTGHNTDWFGYAAAFGAEMPDADLSEVVQFGAGGAGSAVAYALLTMGAGRLGIVEADATRAEALARQLGATFDPARVVVATDPEAAVARASGIVNATPVGMAKYPGTPFPPTWLTARQWVSEIVYFPLETELLRVARALGCRIIDGSGMNVHQAAEAFRLFTGLAPDIAHMRRLFDAAGDAE